MYVQSRISLTCLPASGLYVVALNITTQIMVALGICAKKLKAVESYI